MLSSIEFLAEPEQDALTESDELDSIPDEADIPDIQITVPVDRYGFAGGDQYTDPEKEYRLPLERLRAREIKWMKMCRNWNKWATKKKRKLRDRCRKGIPNSMRCEVWQRLVASPTMLVEELNRFESKQSHRKASYHPSFIHQTLLNEARSLPTITMAQSDTHTQRIGDDDCHQEVGRQPLSELNSPIIFRNSGEIKESKRGFRRFSRLGSMFWKSQPKSKIVTNVRSSIKLIQLSDLVKPPVSPDLYDSHSPLQHFSADYLSLPVQTEGGIITQILTDSSLTSNPCDPVCAIDSPNSFCRSRLSSGSDRLTMNGSCLHIDDDSIADTGFPSGNGVSSIDSPDSFGFKSLPHSARLTSETLESSPLCLSSFSTLPSLTSQTSVSPPPPLHSVGAEEMKRDRTLVAPLNALQSSPYCLYHSYCEQEGEPATLDQIKKDIHRQFPFHELFQNKNSHGRKSLFTVLKAYTVRNPSKGYCQGQAPLAAVLLMFMPEVEAFWTFNAICERYLVAYYDEGLERIQIDGEVLFGLLKRHFPVVYKFLIKKNVEPVLVTVEWFMCIYSRTLPWASVLRVLDMFLCEGKIIIFKVGLVLLVKCFGTSAYRKKCDSLDEILTQLQDIPSKLVNPEKLAKEIVRLPVTRHHVAREVLKQSQRWQSRMNSYAEDSNH